MVIGTCDKLSNVFEAIYHIGFLQRFNPLWSVIFFPLDTDFALSSVLLLTYLAAPKNLLITMTSLCWVFQPMGSPLRHDPRKPKATCITHVPHTSSLGNISFVQIGKYKLSPIHLFLLCSHFEGLVIPPLPFQLQESKVSSLSYQLQEIHANFSIQFS